MLQLRLDEEGRIDWSQFDVDGSNIRADRGAAGARKKGARSASRKTTPSDARAGVGGSKLHLGSDGQGVPLAAVITPGQRHESTQFETLKDGVRLSRRARPVAVSGDRAYDIPRIRRWCRARGIEAVIPAKRSPQPRRSRPVTHDADRYRRRNLVERCIGWPKACRRLATRFEKLAVHFLAMVKLAMIQRCLRLLAEPSNTT